MKLLLTALAAFTLAAQTVPEKNIIRAHGTATVSAKPDQLRIDIGVVTQAQTAQQAGADNATQASRVVDQLKRTLGQQAEIQTVSYSISPNYRYPKEGGTPTITGYTATNIVRVTSPDVSSAGKVIDAATRTGANTIRNIDFSVKDERALRSKALAEAARNARASAEAMASGLGLKISGIARVEESSHPEPPRPMREMAMRAMAADAPPTPVEPGSIQVDATVVLTATIAQ